jgi:Na+-driven multidrug efflux pump
MKWMIYSTGCIVGRTQGIAIIINKFYSTAMNAAYGIGQQVCSQMSFLSNALITAIRPQIIKAEGAGERHRTIRLSEMACKFSFVLMGMVTIPAILHMDDLLSIWLVNVPEHAVMFCQYSLLAFWIDQLTCPMAVANAAIGNVRIYSLWVNTIKLLTVPVVFIALQYGHPVNSIMIIYVIFETVCMLSRLVFLKLNINLRIIQFIKHVVLPLTIPTIVTVFSCIQISDFLSGFSALLNFCISFIIYGCMFLLCGLTNDERSILKSFLIKKR